MQNKHEWSAQYRSLFEDIPIGLYVSTPSGRVERVNAALVEMLGYPDAQTLLATNAQALSKCGRSRSVASNPHARRTSPRL